MRSVLILIASVGFLSCTNNTEIGLAKDVDPESIYYDYQVTGEEEKQDVVVMLQYRFGGKEGTTLIIDEPSKVLVDNEQLKTDSSGFSGAFYELIKPAKSFTGSHTILFIDKNKKEHRETFDYTPFSLAAELPDSLPRQPFSVKLNNFPITARVRLLLTDTSFSSTDINEKLRIDHGEVQITSQMLSTLKKGPVSLEIYSEEDRPVKNGSKEGGRMQITYGLKRQFQLTN